MNIGIIGQGYVGSAIKIGFEPHYNIETYDKYDEDKSTCDLTELVETCKVIFVCVPTPMNKDGSCHTDIVESVVKDIDDRVDLGNISKPIVAQETGTPSHDLTEANFIEDFKNQKRIILGGVRQGTNKLRQIYSKVFPHATIVKTGSKTAEMVKYFINCYLGTKVSFANEMKMVSDEVGIDYDKVVEYATYDERLGKSHWAVPGPDGDLGFGGHCLPKDVSAIVSEFDTELLDSVLKVNNKVRKNKDWEKMKGRAIV